MSACRRHISAGRLLTAVLEFVILVSTLVAQTPQPQPAPAPTPTLSKDDPELQHALDLYHAGNFVAAMPLLEKLSADHPSDGAIKESWAFSVLAYAATLSDPDLHKKARVRARTIALQAKTLGGTGSMVQVVLSVPEDGSEPAFSDRKEVDDVMKAAESDFVRGDFDKAREGYIHALLLDPKNYSAALFIGDVYFKQHVNGSAGEWFARAIEIDPDRETAYRYWGDALWDLGKSGEAREKYIQAIIADPYNQRSWVGLSRWTEHTNLKLNWVRLQDRSEVTRTDDSHTNITLDLGKTAGKADPSGTAWTMYALARAGWQGDKFKKEFPNEPKYRRTLREESDSLHLMVTVMREQKDFEKKKSKLDPPLLQLVQIDHAGFIDPFALLNRADKEIAQDYAPYRAAHRDVLYRYFDEFVVPKAPSPTSQ